MKYNRNVIPKHKGNIRTIVQTPFLTYITVLDFISVVIYKVDIDIRPK